MWRGENRSICPRHSYWKPGDTKSDRGADFGIHAWD